MPKYPSALYVKGGETISPLPSFARSFAINNGMSHRQKGLPPFVADLSAIIPIEAKTGWSAKKSLISLATRRSSLPFLS
jgi:hypothetical protein